MKFWSHFCQRRSYGSLDVDSQDKARGFRTALRRRMGAGRNIGGGAGDNPEANGF